MDRERIRQAMQLLRQYDRETDAKPEIDSQAIRAISELLQAVVTSCELDNDTYEKVFSAYDADAAGVIAMKILAENGVTSAIPEIVDVIGFLYSDGDNGSYMCNEVPETLASFESDGIVMLLEHAVRSKHPSSARSAILEGVKQWGDRQTAVPEIMNALIAEGLQKALENSIEVNTDLMSMVADWKLKGFGELIERAFSLNRIDCGMMGEWDEVRRILHEQGTGLPMSKKPYSSLKDFKKKDAVGLFSDEMVFSRGEVQDEAASKYLNNAMDAFAGSNEGRQLRDAGQELGHTESFLDFGVQYLGVTVEAMTASDVREILLELYPRKVSMESEDSQEVIEELCAFWRFVDRVHQLESAKKFEALIRSMQSDFHKAMSNPNNFGMAKSLFMEATSEGFDISNEQDMMTFMLLHDARMAEMDSSRQVNQGSTSRVDPPAISAVPSMSLKKRKKLLAKKKRR